MKQLFKILLPIIALSASLTAGIIEDAQDGTTGGWTAVKNGVVTNVQDSSDPANRAIQIKLNRNRK